MKRTFNLFTVSALIALCLAITASNSFSQNYLWAKSAGGIHNEVVSGCATDASGNIIVTGYFFSNSITFGTITLNNTDVGLADLFIVKYDANGNVLWAKSASGDYNDFGYSCTTDANGNIIVTGYFESSTITFGTFTLTNSGGYDIFIVKYDANGNVLWAKGAGGIDYNYGFSCATDTNGNIIVTGCFHSPTLSFGAITLTNQNAGTSDFFIVKYDANGNVLWAKSAGGINYDGGKSCATDANGNIIVTGFLMSDAITFGAITLTNQNTGTCDFFIVKYDANGNVLWAKNAGGNDDDYGNSCATDANGNIIVTGYFESSTITFGTFTLINSGGYDIFIVKYDANGNVLWAKNTGGNADDFSISCTTDANGNIIVTGYFESCTITFGTFTLFNKNVGYADIFILKYDANGNVLWAKNAGGNADDYGSSCATDTNGNIIVTGCFMSPSITFGTTTLINANNGAYDIFVTKLDHNSLNTVTGNVFNDANNNGIKDAGENGIKNALVKTKNDNWFFNTDATGNYTAYTAYATDTVFAINPCIYSVVTPQHYAVTAGDTGKNFAVYYTPGIKDLRVTVTNLTPARPGFNDVINVTYENIGTDTMSGTVTLSFPDSSMSYTTSYPACSAIYGNVLTWNYTNLLPSEKRSMTATFTIYTSTPINTVFNFTGIINPIPGDTAPANNHNSIEQIVTGSFDPNEKEVIPGDGLTPQNLANGDKLVFVIHFQNTGTDTAFNIRIADTLSANADAGTFEILSSSHPCSFNMKGAGIVEFVFSSILLPDSNVNFAGSNGFVKYAVKPKPGLIIGDSITNTAYIYFDYNSPIQTNITSSLIHLPYGIVENFNSNEINISPNPANSVLSIELGDMSRKAVCRVYDILGAEVMTKTFAGNKPSLDISALPKGLYLLKVESEGKTYVNKFVKE